MLRAAAYARFSTDLQRATSIEDQVATARRYAAAHGWSFLEDHVYADAAISGVSLQRPGIQALVAAAAQRPRPFDVLLVDDSSRVSRDLADAVRLLQELKFAGVRVIYISQNIDSASEQAETLVAVHGIVDGLFLAEMAKKIKRGLAGQLERGFATGSITFGYRTVAVPDPSGKTDVNGYPVLLGKRVEVEPTEARVITQIFEWYAEGLGCGRILTRLHAERLPGPRGQRWKMGALKRLLVNERYTGQLIWGQRVHERRPGTRQKVVRTLPRAEWHVLDRPDLRIVSAALWERVQARRALVHRVLPVSADGTRTLMRGRHAHLYSRNLFGGFLRCGICGHAISTVHHGGGSPRYGCGVSHRNGVSACPNRLTIRAKVADAQLLAGLQAELLHPDTLRFSVDLLTRRLNAQIDDRPQLLAEAQAARRRVADRLQRFIHAIGEGVPPGTLTEAIAEHQAELARLDTELTELAEASQERLAVLPSWVDGQLRQVASLLTTNTPERTKMEFLRLGLRVVLHPIHEESARPFYRAVGEAMLPGLAGSRDLRQMPNTFVDRLDPQTIHKRTWEFRVDLPANNPGPWSRRTRAG